MMEPYQFDLEDYRRRLAVLSTPELEAMYRQIDPVELPQQWRAAVDELARRGVVTIPGSGSVYAAAGPKKSSIPLAVRFGCVGCLSYLIFTAAVMGFMFKELPSFFPGVMTHLNAMSGEGFVAINYNHSKVTSFEGKSTDKQVAMLLSDGVWTTLPSPPETGQMAWDGSALRLFGRKGAYDLPFDSDGNPAKAWGGPVKFESEPGECRNVVTYRGKVYYSFDSYSDSDDEKGEGSGSARHLVDGDGKEVDGPLKKGFEYGGCPTAFEVAGKMYVFYPKYESKTQKLAYRVFDGETWGPERTIMEGRVGRSAIGSDGRKIFMVYEKSPDFGNGKNFFKTMREMQKAAGRLYGFSFDGEKKTDLPELKTRGMGMFDVAGDGKDVYLLVGEAGLESPNVYRVDGDKWRMTDRGAGKEFSMFPGGKMGKLGMLSWLLFVPLVAGTAAIASRMIYKERGDEIVLAGRTVKVPTLLRRAGAFGVDWAIFYPAGQFVMTHFMKTATEGSFMPDFSSPMLWVAYGSMPMIGVLFFLYFFVMEGFCGGQTVGKKLFKIRVVNQDLTPVKPGGAALRALLRFVDGFMFHFVTAAAVAHSEKFQRVGDMAAKTVVIMDGEEADSDQGRHFV